MVATTEQLLDLDPSIGQRASTTRFDLLDAGLGYIGSVSPDMARPGTVSLDTTRKVKRTLQGLTLNASEQGSISPYSDRIRPVWVLQNGAEFNLGVFLFASVDRARFDWGLDADVALVDQTVAVDQPTSESIALLVGTSIRGALVELLAPVVPAYYVDPTIAASVAQPIAWPAGKSRLKVVDDLAALGGAFPLYFDNDGVATVRKVDTPTTPLTYAAGGRIFAGSMVESEDVLDSPNRYIVIDSSTPETPIVGTYDIPDSAPHSALNRGFVVAEVIEEQGLGNVGQANERARAAFMADPLGYEWVQFSSAPDPRHDTYDEVDYLGNSYRELGWSLPLIEGSEMTHDLRRAYTEPI